MKINNSIEQENGKVVTFQGELNGLELDYVIQVGLNYLMYHGLLASTRVEEAPEQGDMH